MAKQIITEKFTKLGFTPYKDFTDIFIKGDILLRVEYESIVLSSKKGGTKITIETNENVDIERMVNKLVEFINQL